MSKNARKRQRQERRQAPRAAARPAETRPENLAPTLTTKDVKRPEKRSPYEWAGVQTAEIRLEDQLVYTPSGTLVAAAIDFPCMRATVKLREATRQRRKAGGRPAIA